MKKIIVSLLFSIAFLTKADSLNLSSAGSAFSSLSSGLLIGEDLNATYLTSKKSKLEKKAQENSIKPFELNSDFDKNNFNEPFSQDESLGIFLSSFASLKGIKSDKERSKSRIEKDEKKVKKIILIFDELKGNQESINTIKNLVNSDFRKEDIVLAIKELRQIIPKMVDSTSFPKFIKSFIINSIKNSSPEELSKNKVIKKFVVFLQEGKEEAIQRLESIKETVLAEQGALGGFDLVERVLSGFAKQESTLETSHLSDVVLS